MNIALAVLPIRYGRNSGSNHCSSSEFLLRLWAVEYVLALASQLCWIPWYDPSIEEELFSQLPTFCAISHAPLQESGGQRELQPPMMTIYYRYGTQPAERPEP